MRLRRSAPHSLTSAIAGLLLAAAASVPVVVGAVGQLARVSSAAAQMDDAPWTRGPGHGAGATTRGAGPTGTFGGRGAAPLAAGLEALTGVGDVADADLADPEAILASAGLGTYIDEVLAATDSLVTRWPVRTTSGLRFWVQPGAALEGWTPEHRRMIAAAFDEWNAADLPVHFTETADSASAHVVVVWRGQFDEPISGKTRWTHDRRGWIRNARVTIALRRYTGEPLDTDAVRAIALHEIGHALGLDHTSDPTNVMAPKVRVRALSLADRATAQLLYRLPAGSLKR